MIFESLKISELRKDEGKMLRQKRLQVIAAYLGGKELHDGGAGLYQFPKTAIMKYHKLWGLKPQKGTVSQFKGLEI